SNAEGIATSGFRILLETEDTDTLFGEWVIYGSVEAYGAEANDTCEFEFGWLVELTQIETADTYGDLKSSFAKGGRIHFNIIMKNIAFTSKLATFTIVVYDESDTPIAYVVSESWSISPGLAETFIIGMQIPEWVYIGVGTVYANAFTDLPRLHGTPYCLEISTTFRIIKS
ncbi:hypothetical protein KAI31_02500, partial [Candidatus Bathyarchaeota archaeon]|nr:hypothetical protein [Candidatus Bathyarchaeota archaeon]